MDDTKAFVELRDRTSAAYEQEISNIRRQQESVEKSFAAFRAELTDATNSFVRGGVAVLSASLGHHFRWLPERKPRQYFKELAKELGRPLILAVGSTQSRYNPAEHRWDQTPSIELTMPVNTRMKNAFSLLSLVAAPGEVQSLAPVASYHSDRTWKFVFRGEEGIEHFNQFTEFCRTNPVMRVVLQLPRE